MILGFLSQFESGFSDFCVHRSLGKGARGDQNLNWTLLNYKDPGINYYEQKYQERILNNLKKKASALRVEFVPQSKIYTEPQSPQTFAT